MLESNEAKSLQVNCVIDTGSLERQSNTESLDGLPCTFIPIKTIDVVNLQVYIGIYEKWIHA